MPCAPVGERSHVAHLWSELAALLVSLEAFPLFSATPSPFFSQISSPWRQSAVSASVEKLHAELDIFLLCVDK
jgi:hypothetical protein